MYIKCKWAVKILPVIHNINCMKQWKHYLFFQPIFNNDFFCVGLYAVYADSNGDMDIARLDRDTLEREQVWKTGKQKRKW